MLEAQVTSNSDRWLGAVAYVCLCWFCERGQQLKTVGKMKQLLPWIPLCQPRLLVCQVCPSNPICSPGILRFSAPNAAEVRVRTPVKLGESLCFMRCPTVQASDSSWLHVKKQQFFVKCSIVSTSLLGDVPPKKKQQHFGRALVTTDHPSSTPSYVGSTWDMSLVHDQPRASQPRGDPEGIQEQKPNPPVWKLQLGSCFFKIGRWAPNISWFGIFELNEQSYPLRKEVDIN